MGYKESNQAKQNLFITGMLIINRLKIGDECYVHSDKG